MYDYKVVEVTRVIDGDTVEAVIDVGFHLHTTQRLRLLGVDTPERGEPRWAEATEFTRAWVKKNEGNMRVSTVKTDSFGRYLAAVYAIGGQSLSADLLADGFKPYVR